MAMKKGAARSGQAAAHNRAVPARILLRGALAAACVAGAIASTVTYVSEVRLQSAVDEALGSLTRCPHVLSDLRASRTPLNPSPRRDLALAGCLLEVGRGQEADRTMERLVAREPQNARVWVMMAVWEAARHRVSAARASRARAVALDPQLPARRH
jgi:predicted Zn-dependent protease